ncbi:VC0807 family protein [Burkholderia gladioli]|uniref:VC0807 family protein n=1 Tax=Burkholderia gladioli TaxID=28095 RepID=UPI0016420273|nr:VC0807 family protein [Burkholderia gladioli]
MKIRVAFVAELAVNFVLPWVVYRLALPSWGESGALYASAVPPLLWGIVEFARTRRVDALSAIALLGIALSIALMAGGGSPRLLLARESFVSGTIGVVFLVSLVFKRPITYYLTRATVAREGEGGVERFERLWEDSASVRSALRLITLMWGLGLVIECSVRSWCAWNWPIERTLVVTPILSYVTFGGLMVWTFWLRKRLRGRVQVGEATL